MKTAAIMTATVVSAKQGQAGVGDWLVIPPHNVLPGHSDIQLCAENFKVIQHLKMNGHASLHNPSLTSVISFEH